MQWRWWWWRRQRHQQKSKTLLHRVRGARVRVQYDTHLNALSLQDLEKLCSVLAGKFLPTLHGQFIYKNWHLCGICWDDCKHKNLHIPTPPEVSTTVDRLIKAAWEDWYEYLQPIGGRPSSSQKQQSNFALTNLDKCTQLPG